MFKQLLASRLGKNLKKTQGCVKPGLRTDPVSKCLNAMNSFVCTDSRTWVILA